MEPLPPILRQTDKELEQGFWTRHRFLLLIIATIGLSLTMVVISLVAYNVSGTAQLDLSRPGYQSVRDQVERTDQTSGFSGNGPVNTQVLEEFTQLFDEQAARAKAVDAFNGDPLNPEVLYAQPAQPIE